MKKVCVLLVFTMTMYPFHFMNWNTVFADEISDKGREGQAFAEDLVDGYRNAMPTSNNGTISLPTMTNGVFQPSNETLQTNDLYPGTSSANPNVAEYFPEGTQPDVSHYQSSAHDADAVDQLGTDSKDALFQDSQSPIPTMAGAAYGLMADQVQRSRPDLSNDPSFQNSRDILTNIDQVTSSFGDCETLTDYLTGTRINHVPTYRTCERIVDRSTSCTVIHNLGVTAPEISFDGEELLQFGSENVSYWWSTQTGNRRVLNLSANGHGPFTAVARFRFYVNDPTEFSAFYVNGDIFFDEGGVAWFRDSEGQNSVLASNISYSWNATNSLYTPGLTWAWGDYTPNPRDLLPLLRTGWNEIGVSVTNRSRGGGLRLNVAIETRGEINADSWTPDSCLNAYKGVTDGFATGSYTCTSSYENDGNCTTIDNVGVCTNQIGAAPFQNVSQFCRTLDINVNYNFFQGQFCYTAANGEEVCAQSGQTSVSSCAQYETDEECAFVSQECVDGAAAADGTCYLFKEVWDCGYDVEVEEVTAQTQINCTGEIRCMGSDCLDPTMTQSQSFTKAVAVMNAAQLMVQDMNCTETGDCYVFSGKPLECKVAVGGVQDCCDVPTHSSPGALIQGLMQVAELDSQLVTLDKKGIWNSGYKEFHDTVANGMQTTVDYVTKPFSSYTENITSSVSKIIDPVEQTYNQLKTEIQNAIKEIMDDIMSAAQNALNIGGQAASNGGTAVADDQMKDQVAQSSAEQLGSNIAAAANVLMTAYTVYMIAMMIIQNIYKCEEPEFELATKKDQNACTYIGSYCADEVLGACIENRESYCCFNSPMSRILNEQIMPQLGQSFGTARAPVCGGIRLSQLENVDWSQVNLDEWIALLQVSGLMPSHDELNFESLTGTGNTMNYAFPNRMVAPDRTEQRFDNLDGDGLRRNAAQNTQFDVGN